MTTPFTERYELFKTVKSLHNKGKITLSSTEQSQIENQTMDLIRKSVLNKSAGKVPEGFEDLLSKIQIAEDGEEAYELIKDFMRSEGVLDSDGDMDDSPIGDDDGDDNDADDKPEGFPKGNPVMDAKPMDDPEGKGPLGGKGHKPPMGDGGDDSDDMPMGGKGKMDGPHKGKGPMGDGDDDSDDMPMGGKGKMDGGHPGGKGPMGGGPPKGMDIDKMKAKVLRQASDMDVRRPIKELQDEASKKGKEISEEEMGTEKGDGTAYTPGSDDHDISASSRAGRVKIAITRSKTLVAHHVDYGPIFHAVPSKAIRNDPAALRRLANRVYGLCVSDGYAKAAELCNAQLLPSVNAGVDDDVELDSVEDVSPASKGVDQDGESDVRETYDDGDSTVLTGGEVDTQDKPETITAKRKAVALHANLRRRMSKDILDDAENVNRPSETKPKKPSMDVTDGSTTNSKEQHSAPGNSSLDKYDNDIRKAQKHMTQIYAKRMEKRVAEEKEAFVRKLTRAMRIVSTRMRLNHIEHPLKIASVDVLASEGGEIEFSDSDIFSGMDVSAAVELTELIMHEGQDAFLKSVLEKSADLMEKDDKYLSDIESDLFDQAPIPVSVDSASRKSSSQRRAANKRTEAVDGSNFDGNNGHPVPRPEQFTTNASVSNALGGDTRIGRRLGRYQRGQAR